MIIKLEGELIGRILEGFKVDHKNIKGIMNAAEAGKLDTLRLLMDDSIDFQQKEINQNIFSGEEAIHNSKVSMLKNMYALYSEILNIVNEELDLIDGSVDKDEKVISN